MKHQKSGERMQAHYLSWQSQNEFLSLCARKPLNEISSEIDQSYYYGLIVDGTPDVSLPNSLPLCYGILFLRTATGKWLRDF